MLSNIHPSEAATRARLCWAVIWRGEDSGAGMRFDLLKHLKSAVNKCFEGSPAPNRRKQKNRVGVGVSLRRIQEGTSLRL